MAQATQTKRIGERDFTVTALSGWASLRTYRRLFAVLAPSLGAGFENMGESLAKLEGGLGNMEAEKLLGAIGPILSTLFEKLTEAEMEALAKALLSNATVVEKGQTVRVLDGFELLFQGQVAEILQLLVFSVEVNYGDFFALLAGLRGKFKVRKPDDSKDSATA